MTGVSTAGTGPQLTLRPYQREAIEAVVTAWKGGMRRPAVELPTGSGKTVMFTALAREFVAGGGRFAILAHRTELIDQAIKAVHNAAPGLKVARFQGQQRSMRGADGVVASMGTLRSTEAIDQFVRFAPSAIIVDECHHATATTYRRVLEAAGSYAPPGADGALTLGVSATMVRGDGVALGHVWEEIVYRKSIIDMIRMGYLCLPRCVRVRIAGLDLGRVSRSSGDWQADALGSAMSDAMAPEAIARAVSERASDRRGFVFAPTVSLAYDVAEALNAAGLSAVAMDGTTHASVRADTLDTFRAGKVDWLVNVGLFTEGTDLPMADCVVMARPTSSVGLYMQMAGRGLRTYPGKRDCLIIDVVGVAGRYKLAGFSCLTGNALVDALAPEEVEEIDRLSEELDLLGLNEAVEKLASGGGGPDLVTVDGQLEYEEIDLFSASHQQWLQTHRGAWCLVAGNYVVALAPTSQGRYDVVELPLKTEGGRFVVRDVDMSYAMSWGEQAIQEIESKLPYGVAKKAGWRRNDPSLAQLRAARFEGLTVPLDATSGDVGDMLSIEAASRRIDHLPMFAGVTR